MENLIEQIQREAIDTKISVSDLLRKMKLAAAKLDLPKLEGWVDSELKGYDEGDVPSYRKIDGMPVARTLYHGTQPLQLSEDTAYLASFDMRESIASLEENLAADSKNGFIRNYPAGVVALLNRFNRGQISQAGIKIGASALKGVVDIVRTLILEWAIEMEKHGVSGDGLKFTQEEKSKAANATSTVQIFNHGTIVGNVGVANRASSISANNISTEKVSSLLGSITQYRSELVSAGVSGAELDTICNSLRNETEKSKPDQTILSQLLGELQTKLKAAAGSVAAQGLISMINIIFGLPTP